MYLVDLQYIAVVTGTDADRRPQVVDVSLFNGEPLSLLRLHYLRDVVDIFVVTELKVSFGGTRKKTFLLDKFNSTLAPLEKEGKLIRLYVETFPFEHEYHWRNKLHLSTNSMLDLRLNFLKDSRMLPFAREKYLRDFASAKVIDKMKGHPFIMIVCDADELPSREFVRKLPTVYDTLDGGARLDMLTFYYSFQWVKPMTRWTRAFVINDRNITRTTSVNDIRFFGENLPILRQAGWHCSYCGSPKYIASKLRHESLVQSHQGVINSRRSEILNETWINLCREHGYDILGRTSVVRKLTRYNGSEGYPSGVANCRSTIPACSFLEIPH
jgi:hypothetical protein